jgi:hypothetical protein
MADKKVVKTEDINNPEIEGETPKPKVAAKKKPAAKKAPAKKEPAAKKAEVVSGDVMLFMRHGAGYAVGNVKFTRTHPYQLVAGDLAERLLSTEQFEEAATEAVKEFYGE